MPETDVEIFFTKWVYAHVVNIKAFGMEMSPLIRLPEAAQDQLILPDNTGKNICGILRTSI